MTRSNQPPRGSPASHSELIADVPPEPGSVPIIRQFVKDLEWSKDEDSDMRLSLLVSELVTNAVLHARTTFAVQVTMTATAIRVSVTDGSSVLPERRTYNFLHPTGRGLHLVDSLSDRWGVDLEPTGKTVWFELDRLAGIA